MLSVRKALENRLSLARSKKESSNRQEPVTAVERDEHSDRVPWEPRVPVTVGTS